MRVQKLELFIHNSIKLLGCLFTLESFAITLGSIALITTSLGFVSTLKGLVKSYMSVISSCELDISVTIVSGIRLLSNSVPTYFGEYGYLCNRYHFF